MSRMSAFDALSSSSPSSLFLLNRSLRECHTETEHGVDFHVVEMRVLWATTLLCDSESAAGSQLMVCKHDLAPALSPGGSRRNTDLHINANSVLFVKCKILF